MWKLINFMQKIVWDKLEFCYNVSALIRDKRGVDGKIMRVGQRFFAWTSRGKNFFWNLHWSVSRGFASLSLCSYKDDHFRKKPPLLKIAGWSHCVRIGEGNVKVIPVWMSTYVKFMSNFWPFAWINIQTERKRILFVLIIFLHNKEADFWDHDGGKRANIYAELRNWESRSS